MNIKQTTNKLQKALIQLGRDRKMKRKSEMQILVSSPVVTELLKKLFINGGESLPKVNIPNLADYSTRFKDIR